MLVIGSFNVPCEVAHEDSERGVETRREILELLHIFSEHDVTRQGKADEDCKEDNGEVEDLARSAHQRVGHQLQPRICLKGLEELHHDRHDVQSHSTVKPPEEAGYERQVIFDGVEGPSVQRHDIRAQSSHVTRIIEQGLNAVGLHGGQAPAPDCSIAKTCDDANPINSVPEAAIVLDTLQPRQAHCVNQVPQLHVHGVEEE
mmetsp:Transcript_28283/g.59918  ORF Transcript_28283/g.59918 Transcript_28283/m.59918 type:complete len:202 (-) Transcript_28283:347-952(-)